MKSLNIYRYYFTTTIPLLDNISFTIHIVYNHLGDNTSSRQSKMAESSTFNIRSFDRQPSYTHNVFWACPIHLQTSAGSLKGSFINPIHCNDFYVKSQDEAKLSSPTVLFYRRSPLAFRILLFIRQVHCIIQFVTTSANDKSSMTFSTKQRPISVGRIVSAKGMDTSIPSYVSLS